MEDNLAADLLILQNHLDGMLDNAQQNSLTLQRFHSFEMKLMQLNSLDDIIGTIFDDAKVLFDLDVISLCLIDEKGELERFLNDKRLQQKKNTELIFLNDSELLKTTFGLAISPYLGAYKASKCVGFFRQCEKKPNSVIITPLKRRGKYLGSLNFGSFNPQRFVHSMTTDFIEHMASVVGVCIENTFNFEILRRSTLVDTLTGLNNRQFLEQRIGEEIERTQRNGEPLCCFFLDIDHFKPGNDVFGGHAGDHLLTVAARAIREQMRNIDVLARYGGEQFAALLSNVTESEALIIADRIRRSISEMGIECFEQSTQLSISIGIATYIPGQGTIQDAEEVACRLMGDADNALKIAKQQGRNRVVSGGVITDQSIKKANTG